MLSKVFFIGENSIAVRRPNARRKTNRSVAAGILPAVSGGILPPGLRSRTRGMTSLPHQNHPAGSRAIRQPGMAGATVKMSDCVIFADMTSRAGLRFSASIEGAFHSGGGKI
jgi:hypothetical protein